MPQKAKPDERTILQALAELAGYEDVRTAEDLPQLSESGIFSEWVLPAVTGASAETEEYIPGALDLAFTIPVVGGSIKTGFKLAKEGAKRLGRKIGLRHNWLSSTAEGYQPGTYEEWAQQAEEVISPSSRPVRPAVQSVRTAEQSIQYIIDRTQGMIRGGVGGGDLTYRQAKAIYQDIGEQGFREFKEELLPMPSDARGLAVDNFMAKYKVSVGSLSGQEGVVAYKQARFTSRMPDQVINTTRGSTKLEVKTYRTAKNKSRIRIEMQPLDYEERLSKSWQLGAKGLDPKRPGKAYAEFSIEKVTNKAGETFDRVYNAHFYGTGNESIKEVIRILPDGTSVIEFVKFFPGQRYAGLIMHELLTKVPPNTLIDEALLTYDSLYSLIKSTIKTQSKLIFNNPNLRERLVQSSGPSEMSPISKLWNKMVETGSATDEATDRVIAELDKMVKQYTKKGMVEGIPEFRSKPSRGKGYIQYNPISVQKLGILIAGALGFKNQEALLEFLSYDPDSVESKVFDDEFSL